MVFLCQNRVAEKDDIVHVVRTTAKDFPAPIQSFTIHQSEWERNPRTTWLVRVSNAEQNLLHRLESAKWSLGQLCTINQGLRTGDNQKYLGGKKDSSKWKQAAGGKEVGKYQPLADGLFVLYDPNVLDAPRRPEIFESAEKIVVQEIRNITLKERLIATYDDQQTYCLQSTNVINLLAEHQNLTIKYLLGIINSRAANRFFQLRFPGNNHIPSNQLAQIPIPQPSNEQQRQIIKLVDRILAAKKRDPGADTTALERELDELVYALYGLTDDEIKLVEGRAQK